MSNKSKILITIDANDIGKNEPVSNSSPLEVKTKAGKLIVTAVEEIRNDAKETSGGSDTDTTQQQSLEINTKNGKLVVTATTKNKTLENIVLERTIAKDGVKDGIAAKTELDAGGGATKPVVKPRRERVDFSRSSLERNFITPARAISDFLLKLSDLDSLPKTKRRSPYEQEPPIIVYWRKDVEAKAIEVWGSRENLLRECLKREIEKKRHQQSICNCFFIDEICI